MNPVKSEDQLYIRKKKHNYFESCFLPEIGSQGVVSDILSGKRQLNVRQLRLKLGLKLGTLPIFILKQLRPKLVYLKAFAAKLHGNLARNPKIRKRD